MTNKQKSYIECGNKAINIAQNTDCLNDKIQELSLLTKSIENQELLVPVIGGFSSGKSSLINSFLGSNVLGVAITPQTAIATELRYSQDEKIEAIKDDDSIEIFDINDLKKVEEKAQTYNHIKLYLNNQKLKEIDPIVLVDMPGFNAPIDTHNKAISRYMPNGVYFIALLSGADEKTITKTYITELNGIHTRGKEFQLCISKTNMIPQSDIEQIKSYAKDTLEMEFGYSKDIELLDDNSGAKLEKILKDIDIESLFESIYKPHISMNLKEMESTINTTISALRYDKQDAINAIDELKNGISQIEIEKKKAIDNANSKYNDTNIEGIIGVVSSALSNNATTLAQSALNGGDIQSAINNIINSVLPSEIQKRLSGIQQNVIDNFKLSIGNIDMKASDIQTWADGLKEIVSGACFVANTLLNSDINKKSSSALVSSAIGIGGGALATQALAKIGFTINPIVGTILSAVFAILPGIFGKLADSKRLEAVKEQVQNEVIPSILSQIRPELNEYFAKTTNDIINAISQEFTQKMSEKEDEIKNAQKEKELAISEVENKISYLEDRRVEIQTLIKNI
ncbi:dynamin family protein [Campylobacter devanensis]|uniref:dynamin family protein n=1 Tax=Campylobacter devanensis TaxID=3161138 RepID=UPI000A32E4D5|nr:dynamin family protein [Campylobacter sp. P0139]